MGSLPAGQAGVDLKGIERLAAVHHLLAAVLKLSPDCRVWGEGGARGLKSLLTVITVDPKTYCVRSVLGSLSLLGGWPQLSILYDQSGASRASSKASSFHSEGRSLASPGAPASPLPRCRVTDRLSFPWELSRNQQQRQGRGKGSHPRQPGLSHLAKNSLSAWGCPSG